MYIPLGENNQSSLRINKSDFTNLEEFRCMTDILLWNTLGNHILIYKTRFTLYIYKNIFYLNVQGGAKLGLQFYVKHKSVFLYYYYCIIFHTKNCIYFCPPLYYVYSELHFSQIIYKWNT